MLIPVSTIVDKTGRSKGTMYFDTDANKYQIQNTTIIYSELPLIYTDPTPRILGPYEDDVVNVDNYKALIVGQAYGNCVVNLGRNQLHCMRPEDVKRYRIVGNYNYDLNYLFSEDKLYYAGENNGLHHTRFSTRENGQYNTTTISVGNRATYNFKALYGDRQCFVRVKAREDTSIDKEVTYARLAAAVNVPCCKIKVVTYDGRKSLVSFRDSMKSYTLLSFFENHGISFSETYNMMSREEQRKFDRMLLLDYLVKQTDRHSGNIAIYQDRTVYPFFDNESCLDYDEPIYEDYRFFCYIESLPVEYLQSLITKEQLYALKELDIFDKERSLGMIYARAAYLGMLV